MARLRIKKSISTEMCAVSRPRFATSSRLRGKNVSSFSPPPSPRARPARRFKRIIHSRRSHLDTRGNTRYMQDIFSAGRKTFYMTSGERRRRRAAGNIVGGSSCLQLARAESRNATSVWNERATGLRGKG